MKQMFALLLALVCATYPGKASAEEMRPSILTWDIYCRIDARCAAIQEIPTTTEPLGMVKVIVFLTDDEVVALSITLPHHEGMMSLLTFTTDDVYFGEMSMECKERFCNALARMSLKHVLRLRMSTFLSISYSVGPEVVVTQVPLNGFGKALTELSTITIAQAH